MTDEILCPHGREIRCLECAAEYAEEIKPKVAGRGVPDARVPTRCENCGHVELHNGPAGDIPDACTFPGCHCGYDSRGIDIIAALEAIRQPAAVPDAPLEPPPTELAKRLFDAFDALVVHLKQAPKTGQSEHTLMMPREYVSKALFTFRDDLKAALLAAAVPAALRAPRLAGVDPVPQPGTSGTIQNVASLIVSYEVPPHVARLRERIRVQRLTDPRDPDYAKRTRQILGQLDEYPERTPCLAVSFDELEQLLAAADAASRRPRGQDETNEEKDPSVSRIPGQ